MLTNTLHQSPDHSTSDPCDTARHASTLPHTPYWNETVAALSISLWLPDGTTDHDSPINTTQPWDSKTAAHSWFSTNRIAAPNPDLPKLYSPAAVQDTATHATTGASKPESTDGHGWTA